MVNPTKKHKQMIKIRAQQNPKESKPKIKMDINKNVYRQLQTYYPVH